VLTHRLGLFKGFDLCLKQIVPERINIMGFLSDFFFGREETVEEKADKVGWEVEQTSEGYTVKGVDAWDDKPATWTLDTDQAKNLLDHVHSVNLGDAYRQEKFGLAPGEEDTSPDWCEHKHEIREYRLQALEDESKPLWKQLLGL
jgi:hypothetical protein